MVTRDNTGKFVKGVSGNPAGRPRKEREERFYDIAVSAVTFDDFNQIVKKAVEQAKRGDTAARKWLSDYLMGLPIQKVEQTGDSNVTLTVVYEKPNDKEL
jgi:hypothetical protein